MATIICPHCGKEMYEELLECPNCHGPIEHNVEVAIDELVAERDKKEKKALLVSAILGAILSVMFFGSGLFSGDKEASYVIVSVFMTLLGFVLYSFMFYGIRRIYLWLKQTALWGIFLIPFVGWMAGIMIVITVGFIAGLILAPIAIIKMIMKKPIITKEKILKELENQ